MIRALVLAVALLCPSGCASILAPKHRTVPFRSEPAGAEVWVDGQKLGETPVNLEMRNSRTYRVTFRMDGYPDREYPMRTVVNGGWVVLDILFGIIPVAIDAATGEWKSLKDPAVTMVMDTGQQPPTFVNVFGETVKRPVERGGAARVEVVPSKSAPPSGTIRVSLNNGVDLHIRRAEPSSFDTVKLTKTDGAELYVAAVSILAVTGDDGRSLYHRLLTDRKAIP